MAAEGGMLSVTVRMFGIYDSGYLVSYDFK